MNRTPHWILNGLTILCLLLGLVLTAMWIRSHWVVDSFGLCDQSTVTYRELVSYKGDLEYRAVRNTRRFAVFFPKYNGFRYESASFSNPPGVMSLSALQFGSFFAPLQPPDFYSSGTHPYSVLVVFSLLLPSARAFRWIRRGRKYAVGLCPTCGFDLRATPERCPECGAAPNNSK